ncbi:FadR/GntR family transcriptional regulator [Microbulbifer agarilyticus]
MAGHNLTHQLTHDLGMEILSGKYDDAASFPSEAQLSDQFGVSRSATREAVKMLTAKGMLSSRPRQGIRVMPQSQWNLFDTDVLQWILNSKPGLRVLRDFVKMRSAIEPEAAALAAEDPSDENLQPIELALKRMEDAEQGMDDALESDIDFHCAILQASGNRFFMQLQPFSATALRVSIRHTNRYKGVPTADSKAHAAVLRAIRNRNSAQARRLMRKLVDETLELIDVHLDEEPA